MGKSLASQSSLAFQGALKLYVDESILSQKRISLMSLKPLFGPARDIDQLYDKQLGGSAFLRLHVVSTMSFTSFSVYSTQNVVDVDTSVNHP